MGLGDFLLFATVTIGLTHIVVDSVIMQPFRDWVKAKAKPEEETKNWFWDKVSQAIGCYQCAGFWCGLVAGAIVVSWNPVLMVACGWASSFLALLAAHLLNYLEAKSIIEIPKNGN